MTKGFDDAPTFNVEGVDNPLTLKKIDASLLRFCDKTNKFVEEPFFFGTPKVDYNDEWATNMITIEGLTNILNWITIHESEIFKTKKTPSVSIDEVTAQILDIMKKHDCEELIIDNIKAPIFETADSEKYTLVKIETKPELTFNGSTKFGDGDAWTAGEIAINSIVKILAWLNKNENTLFSTK